MLSRFTVVLLDMNGTFMFGGDRFGPDQDFAATYHALGGRRLPTRVVHDAVLACFETLGVIYEDSARCDSFPAVLDTLRDLPMIRNQQAEAARRSRKSGRPAVAYRRVDAVRASRPRRVLRARADLPRALRSSRPRR